MIYQPSILQYRTVVCHAAASVVDGLRRTESGGAHGSAAMSNRATIIMQSYFAEGHIVQTRYCLVMELLIGTEPQSLPSSWHRSLLQVLCQQSSPLVRYCNGGYFIPEICTSQTTKPPAQQLRSHLVLTKVQSIFDFSACLSIRIALRESACSCPHKNWSALAVLGIPLADDK